VFKTLRGYASEEINQRINDFTNFTHLEETANRWVFTYDHGQKLSLIRVRTENVEGQSVVSEELNLNWPDWGFSKPKVVVTR
jgi:hypothetical protein